MLDPAALKRHFRDEFGREPSSVQVGNIELIVDECRASELTLAQIAYVLATAGFETAFRYEPIKEYGDNERFRRLYDVRGDNPERARRMGNTEPGDGVKYRGRGFVQLTWRNNYAKYGIARDPDAALNPRTAAHILVDGMVRGVFTGKKLSDYINDTKTDFVGARRVVNGTDKAHEIAGIARQWLRILKASRTDGEDDDPTPVPRRRPEQVARAVAAGATASIPVIEAAGDVLDVMHPALATGLGIALPAVVLGALTVMLWPQIGRLRDRLFGRGEANA